MTVALPTQFTNNTIAPAPERQRRTDRMQEWLDLFMKTAEVAEVLARTSFVPAGMQGKPAEVAASMMKGYELGMDPLDALANMYVVKGKVGYSAEFMRRRIIKAGHEFYVTEATDNRAVVKGRRRDGDREAEWQQASFTAEQAKKAGIDLGGYPADKLVARATSRLCRRAFPDVLSGAEIIEDIIDGVAVEVIDEPTAPAAGSPALQRKRTPRKPAATRGQPPTEPAPAPAATIGDTLDDFPEPTAPILDEPDEPIETKMASEKAIQKLVILLTAEGFDATPEGRQGRLDWCAAAVGRAITSSKDLTSDEASMLIDILEAGQNQLPLPDDA